MGCMVLLCSLLLVNIRPLKLVQYFGAPRWRLSVGNYAIVLLFVVRLVLNEFKRSASGTYEIGDTMITKEQIIEFAKAQGYDGIKPLGRWRGYDAYEPTFEGSGECSPTMIGPPLLILVDGNGVRMSTVDEAFAHIDEVANK